LLVVAAAAAGIYVCTTGCSSLTDSDDTLCQAIAAAEGGPVDWPEDERWFSGRQIDSHVFDNIMMNPWWFSREARDYIDGFGISKGNNWDYLGRADVRSYNQKTLCVDTPLGRTYSAYSNLVYANAEGIELDRRHSLGDFDYYDTFLKWSAAFVSQRTYRVDGDCSRHCRTLDGGSCIIARTSTGPFRNDYIELYQTFFYGIDSVWRAATIMHEVRHGRDQKHHTGRNGCGSSACDHAWSDAGANTYEALWLAAYYWTPEDHPYITPARRAAAAVRFWTIVEGGFEDEVRWDLDSMRFINIIPEFYVHQVACSEDPRGPHGCLILAR
jgi:hypothetical protein